MGTLTLADFRSELLFDLRNRTDTSTPQGVTNTRLDMWINAGIQHITHPTIFRHRELRKRFSITLVSGTSGYQFTPTGGQYIMALVSVSHVFGATDDPTTFRVKLLPKDAQWKEKRTVVSGAPREYYVEDDFLYVTPVPSTVEAGHILACLGWREHAILSADADTTELRPLWDEIVLLASRWRAELHLGYRDLAEGTKADFVSLLNEYQNFEQLQGEDWDWDMAGGVVVKGYMAGSTR